MISYPACCTSRATNSATAPDLPFVENFFSLNDMEGVKAGNSQAGMVGQDPHTVANCQHLVHDAMFLTQRYNSCIMPENSGCAIVVQAAIRRT